MKMRRSLSENEYIRRLRLLTLKTKLKRRSRNGLRVQRRGEWIYWTKDVVIW